MVNEFEKSFYDIEELLKNLENLYNNDVITLKSYFEVKKNILEKLVEATNKEKDDIEACWCDEVYQWF